MGIPSGIDVRQSAGAGADRLLFRASLKDSGGADVTSGSATLKLYELQQDGTLKSFDFADNTFKSTALTTETTALTHQLGNNGATPTGLWTALLATLTGFVAGRIYLTKVNHPSASPPSQERQFQYGGSGSDLLLSADGHALVAGLHFQKNQPFNNFEFPMVQSADHVTAATGLTVTAQRSIDGSAFATCANAVVEVSGGVYKINLAASDLNGDFVTLKFSATGADTRLVGIPTQT